jgi:hypothetical protein
MLMENLEELAEKQTSTILNSEERKFLIPNWGNESTVNKDWTLHQIAPFIGRMKPSIARSLIENNTEIGDLVVDPFCGSGVIGLESAALSRVVAIGDWNPYAVLLSKAKLFPPKDLITAERNLVKAWKLSERNKKYIDLRCVPIWVRKFFHQETLRNTLSLRDACIENNDLFTFACLLGILHHQRPGFLSYPSSHLVPYLRNKLYPVDRYPDLYEEREVYPRIEAKIKRVFKRMPDQFLYKRIVHHTDARVFPKIKNIGAIITSPPYLNGLDYIRDNRLRLWFINKSLPENLEFTGKNRDMEYIALIKNVFTRLSVNMVTGGKIILVVGDVANRSSKVGQTIELTKNIFSDDLNLKRFKLDRLYRDSIPDNRRARRECRGTKEEAILIYSKIN